MSWLSNLGLGRGRSVSIHDLSINVPTGVSPQEAKNAFTKEMMKEFAQSGISMAALDEAADRAFAKGIGMTDAQYEALRDHWFKKWTQHVKGLK